jgi:hypothetical protein
MAFRPERALAIKGKLALPASLVHQLFQHFGWQRAHVALRADGAGEQSLGLDRIAGARETGTL